jgi:hypothetical protein
MPVARHWGIEPLASSNPAWHSRRNGFIALLNKEPAHGDQLLMRQPGGLLM